MSATDVLRGLSLAVVSDWATTLGLIFGGCCSNALSLEQLTREHPHSGSLITFAQFVLVSLHGLPKFLVFAPLAPPPDASSSASAGSPRSKGSAPATRRWWQRVPVPRLRRRTTPLAPYLAQVALFYAVSLLNNAAFAYAIPMPVHIIFRSGGLVVSMLMGWLLAGRRYNATQILSVLLVTAGVVLTTLSASAPKGKNASPRSASGAEHPADNSARERWRYATGIALLTLALVLSGLLGIVQDWTYARYVRAKTAPHSAADGATQANGHANAHANGNGVANGTSNGRAEAPAGAKAGPGGEGPEPWQESMFYLHFLSLPMFLFVRHDLAAQFRALRASAPLVLPLPRALALTLHPPFGLSHAEGGLAVRGVPRAYAALALTALTALVCAAGVHRLTARGVSALAVTLLLVVRKAASLVLSVVLFRAGAVDAGVWAGAGMVFVGTMGYAAGSRKRVGVVGAGGGKEKRD